MVDMEGTAVQPLDVEIHSVLKSHGRERKAFVTQPVKKSIKIHFSGRGGRRFPFYRRHCPVPGNIISVICCAAAIGRRVREGRKGLQSPVTFRQK